jgi:hypothetical protein
MTEAIDFIAAFDQAIAKVWGEHLARPWPHPNDKLTADRWLAAGATVELCSAVFLRIMETRKDRRLSIPSTLSYFDNPIRDAIAKGEHEATDLHPQDSLWKARLAAWARGGRWIPDQWGPNPTEAGCRVPRRVLNALGDRQASSANCGSTS